MYCPKCKDNFEEGSRRFCPTDGSRLVSEVSGAGSPQPGGIFANLIPKIEAVNDLDESLSGTPRFTITEPDLNLLDLPDKKAESSDIFFELDDPDPTPINVSEKPVILAEPELLPIARKVQPFEIPAGHVDLGDTHRDQGLAAKFEQVKPEAFIGRIVKGRYDVTEFLGGDETGLAYIAEDKIVDDKKVLVRILIEDDYDEIMSSILAEERVSLSHFSHPNIARLIDSGQFTNGTNFLISEYVDALSVDDILSIHGQFSTSRTARIIRQAASALNEAHQEGIIHRDLRPENLIIDTSKGDIEQVKVVNFGASNGDPNDHNIAYKAPEVLDGRIATTASDIFSLAVVAYEMLTGQMPFEGSTAKEFVRSHYSGLSRMPTKIRPDLPPAIDGIFSKALSHNAADRYSKARDLGDALYTALAESPQPAPANEQPAPVIVSSSIVPPLTPSPTANPAIKKSTISLEPAVAVLPAMHPVAEPAWKNRSPEPPQVGASPTSGLIGAGIIALLAIMGFGAYYFVINPPQTDMPPQTDQTATQSNSEPATAAPPVANTEMPPQPRNIPQPPNTNFYQNSKQNLKGDLLRNFVGFTLYYPKDWKVNGPQNGSASDARGKFLDISVSDTEGRLKEQMLVSYYPSKGTFANDAATFPLLVKETNDTLKDLLPGYQMVSASEIKLNGEWQAYEIKFQGGGTSATGEKLVVWGRRLFVPAARPGVRNGFSITMLATSFADEVRSVDDVGVRGQLAGILYTFEPSQNF